MSLENLPYEVIEFIAQYLSVKEILACCATSSLMRHMFNNDFVWKRKSNLKLIDYLNNTECLVEPSIEWLETINDEKSTLSPLSTWRKHYMMNIRLFRNWREGRYETEQLEFGTKTGIYHSTTVRFYQNDHIVLYTTNINELKEQNEIWNVKESHFLHSTFNLNFSDLIDDDDEIYLNSYQLVDNKLVVSKGTLVLVYEVGLATFSAIPLAYAFLFDLSEEDSKYLITRASTEPDYFLNFTTQVYITICSPFFVGMQARTLHIWNISSGKKVAVESSLINNSIEHEMVPICVDEVSKIVIIRYIFIRERYRFQYFAYELTNMKFGSFNLKHNYCDVMILNNRRVIGVNQHQLFSYDYETSERLAVRKCNYLILKKSITVVGNNLLCGTSDSTIFVMNISSLEIMNSVKLGFTLYSLQSICNRFVIVNTINTELWEINKTAKQLLKFPCNVSFAAVNESGTKIALEKNNKIIILNFCFYSAEI